MTIHSREHLNDGDAVIANCTHQCNFMIMDDSNFSAFRRGSQFTCYGGFFRRFPARVVAPRSGAWNIVLQAPPGSRYGMQVQRRA